MLRKFALLGGVVVLVLGLSAADSQAFFARRHRCVCLPVCCNPCPPGLALDGGASAGSLASLAQEAEQLRKVLDSPLPKAPTMSPEVTSIFENIKKGKK